ncbi:20678_t:CDS:1, partial [Racocetra persica]
MFSNTHKGIRILSNRIQDSDSIQQIHFESIKGRIRMRSMRIRYYKEISHKLIKEDPRFP